MSSGRCCLNIACIFVMRYFVSRYQINLFTTIRSCMLARTDVRELQIRMMIIDLSVDLRIGIIVACSQYDGKLVLVVLS